MSHNTNPKGHGGSLCLMIAIPLILTSCRPLRFTQDFDDTTERRLLQIQERCARFFIRMERQAGTNDGSAAKYVDFYEDVRTDIEVLRARCRATEKSAITQEQLDLLRKEVDQLEILHRSGFHDFEELKPLKDGMETTLVSMQKYQLNLKNRVK